MTSGTRGWLWWWRVAIAVSLVAGVVVGGIVADLDPDPVVAVVLVLVVVALAGLVVDAAATPAEPWEMPRIRDTDARARDARTAGNLRLLESHLTSRHAGADLRDRLRRLAEEALRSRHGLDLDDPRSAELLGADVDRVLSGPPRRLSRAEIAQVVTRIEGLSR